METHATRRARRRSNGVISKALAVSAGVVFLIVSLLASSATAVRLSRSLKSMDAHRVVADLSAQTGSWDFGGYGEEGRKLMVETNDYGNTGANKKHDPPRAT